MRKTVAVSLLCTSVLLAACGSATMGASGVLLDNPLYAEWYYKDLVENMMNLEIQNDPLIKNATQKAYIDSVRTSSLAKAQEATAKRQQGKLGTINPVSIDAKGQVLLLGDTLYFGPDTTVLPGPALHVYVSASVDPRSASGSAAFPTSQDTDLGVITNPYGAAAYAIDPDVATSARSVVLYDIKLKRIYAFAQLQVQR